MATTDLLQEEADALIAMAKIKVSDDLYDYPGTGDHSLYRLRHKTGARSFFWTFIVVESTC